VTRKIKKKKSKEGATQTPFMHHLSKHRQAPRKYTSREDAMEQYQNKPVKGDRS
jgi:hypothetical protein